MAETSELIKSSARVSDAVCRVPIVMAADLGYLTPTLVALDSLFRHSSDPSAIDVYLIVPETDRSLFEASVDQIAAKYEIAPRAF